MPTTWRLWITTELRGLEHPMLDRSDPIHPGEILQEEFLGPLNLTPYKLAKRIGVPVGRITAILKGTRAITSDTAIRLGRFFGTSPDLWLGLQTAYELDMIEDLREEIESSIVPLRGTVAA